MTDTRVDPERGAQGDPFERLCAAWRVLESFDDAADPDAVDRLLAEHDELRDVLEPSLDGAGDDAPDGERVIGDYRIIRELGRGGMGVVFEARQLSLDRPVALKLLAPELALHPAAVARFRREATLAAGLEHPSIAKVYGFVAGGAGHFLVMELIDGTPLDRAVQALAAAGEAPTARALGELLSGGAMTRTRASTATRAGHVAAWDGSYERAIAGIAEQVADALHHAHVAGVIHRDVKPGNILVRSDGTAVLTDFGLARETGTHGVTLTGEVAGTPAYQSPEQISGRARELGPATDVFSLGATLYDLLTLRKPFEGATVMDVQQRVLRHEPAHPSRTNPRIDKDLASIVMRALQKAPADRYASAGAFATDLRCWLEGRPVAARPVPRLVRVRRWCARNPLAASFAGTMAVAALTLAFLLQQTLAALSDFEWLARGARVHSLLAECARLVPPWPEHRDHYAKLVAEANGLVAMLPVLREKDAMLRARATRTDGDAPVFARIEDQFLFAENARNLARLQTEVVVAQEDLARRLAWCGEVAATTITGPAADWARAAADVRADPRFRGFELRPQLDLVPLERDPRSGLWEFWHAYTGARPERAGERWCIGPDTGIVFVLVPPGTARIGAQKTDPSAPNFDPKARPELDNQPFEVVIDAPFFLSKYEMSRGQWRRLGRHLPYEDEDDLTRDVGRSADEFAVNGVTWNGANALLASLGLAVPPESHWEYACRAGTSTSWAFGEDEAALGRAANVRDLDLYDVRERERPKSQLDWAQIRDGWSEMAPVDALEPNDWGLHQMHGNVTELCAEWMNQTARVLRGGDYGNEVFKTTSWARSGIGPDQTQRMIGVRPARWCLQR